jgi:subtilase family serine protease
MRRLLPLVLLPVLLALGAASASGSTLHRIGSAPVTPAGSRVLGALPAATALRVTVALASRDPLALAAYANGVSAPGSGEYHQYLSVAQFAVRFGATPAAIDAVRSSLATHGLTVGAASPNGLSLSVNGTAAAVGAAFATSFRRLALPGGTTAYANTSAPALGADVAGDVQSILGLSDVAHERPLDLGTRGAVVPHALSSSAAVTPCAAAGSIAQSFGAYTVDEIASLYGFNAIYGAGDEGAGQTIGLLELEGNFPSDISAYQSCYGTSANVSDVTVDGGPPAPSRANQDGLETALDAENLIGLAPKAGLAIYQAPNDATGPYDAYRAMITSSSRPNVISTSWGECERDLGATAAAAENTLFEEAATQGQTIVAASGDSGVQDCFGDNTSSQAAPAADDPAAQPFVTGVGGTSIASASPLAQSVWNNGPHGAGATGGGTSIFWPMPSAQSSAGAGLGVINAESSATCFNTYCREVPDVSADADPSTGYVVYYGDPTQSSPWTAVGGTSGAAPVWAALIALANASSSCTAPVGFANRMLYGAADVGSATYFNDITAGNNDWLGLDGGRFAALPGYDEATGLGTPIASALVPALCGGPVTLNAPGTQSSRIGSAVGLQLSASASRGAITYSASGLPPGLSMSSSGLISGTPTTVGSYTVTANAATATQGVSAKFAWTVVTAGTVKLTKIASQLGQVRRSTSLSLRATNSAGTAIRYAAAGLPPGLVLAPATGRIHGTPKTPGRYKVGIAATAQGFDNAYATFTWTIGARPSLTGASMSGGALSFRVSAGADAPSLRTITLRLPSGLSFARRGSSLARLVAVSTASGARASASVSLSGATLRVVLQGAPGAVHVRIAKSGLLAASRVAHTLSVTVHDADGLATALSAPLRQPG